MLETNNILFKPRKYNSISLWKDVKQNQWRNARWQIKNSIRTVDQLKSVININKHQEAEIRKTVATLNAEGKEPLRITPYYASLMAEKPFDSLLTSDNSREFIDPVFWQSVPTPANLLFPDAGVEEAMKESSRTYGAAYQRYPNRVALFVAENTSCASYCVHCQRSKSLDKNAAVRLTEINKGLFYIGYNKNINEVLVTGGDALMIPDNRLVYILEELSKIPHLRSIRIATRVPVVLPMAITDEILEKIKVAANRYNSDLEKYVYFMTHINHYNEITEDLFTAVKKIRDHGFTIRNQTVLLNHVNDDFKILAETFRKMFWIGVHPYYLLQCHKEKGIVHFITPIQTGKIFMKHLQGWISGVTVPRYAANIEGGGGKVLLMPSGHDTLNINNGIENRIADSYAAVSTWDDRNITRYEALGRAKEKEFSEAEKIMEKFIGNKNVFRPKIIIVDDKGNHIRTTNRSILPKFNSRKKSKLLDYMLYTDNMPLTNPATITEKLDKDFNNSRFND